MNSKILLPPKRWLAALALPLLAACHFSVPGNIDRTPPNTEEPPDAPPTAAPVGDWLRGDLHVHDDHSSDGSILRQGLSQRAPGNVSVADQIGQGVRNGLQYMPLTDHRTYDQHYDPLWESSDLLLLRGEEANGSPHSTVQGAVDWLVQGASRLDSGDFDRLQTSIWDAHSQGANWTIAHPDDGETNDDGTPNDRANAVGMDLIEAWNRASDPDAEIDYAENRWNHGWRFGMAGGCDDHFKELWLIGGGPGMPTTGTFASDYNERAILQGLQAGRTRIALDPDALAPHATLEADFDGDGTYEAMCGDEVFRPVGTKGKLRVHVTNALGATVHVYKSPGRSAGDFMSFMPISLDAEYPIDIAVEDQPTWYRVEVRGVGQPSAVNLAAIESGDVVSILSDIPNTLRSLCSPIFVSSAAPVLQPDIPLPADGGSDDGAALALGARGSFAGFPDVAVAGGVTHVVAETHDVGATHVMYRRGAAAAIDLVPTSKTARFPKVAAKGSDVWVAWQDERDGQIPHRLSIYLRHSADAGKTWQDEVKLRGIEGRAEHPDLAIGADGKPVVVWQEISAGNPFDVMAQVIGADEQPVNLTRDGKSVMAANILDTRSSRYPASVWPSVTAAADGRIAVAFQDDRTDPDPLWTGSFPAGDSTDVDNWQIMVRTRGSDGNWGAPASLGADDAADRHPSIAWGADGALVLAWDNVCLSSSGCNLSVLSARSTDGGATWSAPLAIATDPVGMGEYPRLGLDPAGAVRAVWYDSRSADWRWRVMTAVSDATGNWMAVKMLPSRGVNTWPATDGGVIAFASTRNARRLQRDRTQQIFVGAP